MSQEQRGAEEGTGIRWGEDGAPPPADSNPSDCHREPVTHESDLTWATKGSLLCNAASSLIGRAPRACPHHNQ